MTVRELIKALEKMPGAMHVLMDDGNGWYCYVEELLVPELDANGDYEDSTEYMLPTIRAGRTFDARDI